MFVTTTVTFQSFPGFDENLAEAKKLVDHLRIITDYTLH